MNMSRTCLTASIVAVMLLTGGCASESIESPAGQGEVTDAEGAPTEGTPDTAGGTAPDTTSDSGSMLRPDNTILITLPPVFSGTAELQILQYIGEDGGIIFDLDSANQTCRDSLAALGSRPNGTSPENLPAVCAPFIVTNPTPTATPEILVNADDTISLNITAEQQQAAHARLTTQLDMIPGVYTLIDTITYDETLTSIRIVTDTQQAEPGELAGRQVELAAYDAFFYARLHQAFSGEHPDRIGLTIDIIDKATGRTTSTFRTVSTLILRQDLP